MLLVSVSIVLVVLVQGRFFLIPLAIAVLTFTLVSATVDRVANLRIGRFFVPFWLANIIAILLFAAALMATFAVLSYQIDAIAEAAPRYTYRVQAMIGDLFLWVGEDVRESVLRALAEIDLLAGVGRLAGSAGYILTTILLIMLYVGFLFAERTQYPTKLTRLFPNPERSVEVARIVQSITQSLRRYVFVKTVVSILTGALVYVVLRAVELDLAETWALLAVFLNFIPNIGSIIATALPTIAALVEFDSWTPALIILLGVGIIQFVVGNLIEPTLMGRTLNLSAFVIILSLTFWAAIWGMVGMFLAVPITVTIMIVCSHVPLLRPIAILLSADGNPAGTVAKTSEDQP